jgi:hypothetical protein
MPAGAHDFHLLRYAFAVGAAVFGVGRWNAVASRIGAFLGSSHDIASWVWPNRFTVTILMPNPEKR